MTPLELVSLLGILYSLLYIADTFLRTNPGTSLRYLLKLRRLGLELSLFQIKYSTTRYNSGLQMMAGLNPGLTRAWFSLGAVVSVTLVPASLVLLTLSLWQHLRLCLPGDDVPGNNVTSPGLLLQPVLPGLNLPASQLLHYVTSLSLASVYHEAGHAVAAYNCDIKMVCAGLLVLAVFPAAYVELPTAQLLAKAPQHQLRVYTAGVWHNVVLALAAWLLALATPTLLHPLYVTGSGIVVVDVTADSSVGGPGGLVPGDVILGVQSLGVDNPSDYRAALAAVIRQQQQGLCVQPSELQRLEIVSSEDKCCPQDRSDSLCFHQNPMKSESHSRCLPIRAVISANQGSFCPCYDQSECWTPELEGNLTKLLVIQRRDDKEYLYIGNPGHVYQDSTVSGFVPRSSWLPLSLPDFLLTLLEFLTAFSGGLAVLNVVPSYLLDGQHIIKVLVDILMTGASELTRTNIVMGLTMSGTLLVVSNILLGLRSVIFSGSSPMMLSMFK